jgi:thiamine kinase-like enzyme
MGNFFSSGKDLTRGILVGGVYKIPSSYGKFYIGRAHQQFVERFIEHRNSIEKTLQLSKPPETFVSALAEHIWFQPDHFVKFDEALAISNDKG